MDAAVQPSLVENISEVPSQAVTQRVEQTSQGHFAHPSESDGIYDQHVWLLRFDSPQLEGAFVLHMTDNLLSSISFSCMASVVMLLYVVTFPARGSTARLLQQLCLYMWATGVAAFSVLRWLIRLVMIRSTNFDMSIRTLSLRQVLFSSNSARAAPNKHQMHSTGVGGNADSMPSSLGCFLAFHRCRWIEYLCPVLVEWLGLLLLQGGIIVNIASVFAAENEGVGVHKFHAPYTMPSELLLMALAVCRWRFIVIGNVMSLIWFVLCNVYTNAIVEYRTRFLASLGYLTVHAALVMYFAFEREASRRAAFVVRIKMEQHTDELRVAAKLAAQSAERCLPLHVVAFLTSGARLRVEVSGVVCAVGLVGVCRWSTVEGRGPSDVVDLLVRLTEIFERSALDQLRRDPSLVVTRANSFGDTLLYTIFGAPSAPTHSSDFVPVGTAMLTRVIPAFKKASWCIEQGIVAFLREQHRRLSQTDEGDVSPSEDPELMHVMEGNEMMDAMQTVVAARYASQLSVAHVVSVGAVVARGSVVEACLRDVSSTAPRLFQARSRELNSGSMGSQSRHNASHRDAHTTVNSSEETGSHVLLIVGIEDDLAATTFIDAPPEGTDIESVEATATTSAATAHHAEMAISEATRFQAQRRGCARVSRAFCNSETEAMFRKEQFDQRKPLAEAVFMVLFGLLHVSLAWSLGTAGAMWTLLSPMPYAVLCLCAGLMMMLLLIFPKLPPCIGISAIQTKLCGSPAPYEILMWAYTFLFLLTAAATGNSSTSMLGVWVIPWTCVAVAVSIMRPLSYPPLVLWSLDIILACVTIFRSIVVEGAIIGVLVGVAYALLSLIWRLLLDYTAASRFAARHSVDIVQKELVRFIDRTRTALRCMAPKEAVEQLLLQRTANRLQASSAESITAEKSLRFQPNHTHGRLVDPLRSTLIATMVEERAVGMMDIHVRGAVPGHPLKYNGDNVVIDAFRQAISDIRDPYFSSHVRAVLVKYTGDVVQFAAGEEDPDGFRVHADRGQIVAACVAVLLGTVRRLVAVYGPGSPTMAAGGHFAWRAWVDWCPTVGALVGDYCPTFEWYGPRLQVGHALLRLRPEEGGPLEWSMAVVSDVAASALVTNRANDPTVSMMAQHVSPALQWRVRGVGQVKVHALR